MLTDPLSIYPGALLTIATIFFLAIAGGTIPAPGWLRDISYPCAIGAAWHAILADVVYLIDHTTRAKIMLDAMHIDNPKPRSEYSPDYIMIGHSGVRTDALRWIAQQTDGNKLPPESRASHNQLAVRAAYDALAEQKIITPPSNKGRAEIVNPREWELIVKRL